MILMPNKTTLQNIHALGLVEEITSNLGIQVYVWGGFTIDIYSNKILRDHKDVDHLIVNLYDHIPKLKKQFVQRGWKTEILRNGDLGIKKDKSNIQFGHLEIKKDAKWYHNGEKGTIIFPKDWLNPNSLQFLNFKVHAVYPEFQYVLKKNPKFMNPLWEIREQDKKDIKQLEEILKMNKDELNLLLKQVRFINYNN
jgi:hypothetical protein